jgi:predicted metal-dependent HD superfamily phosphohydrolase
VTVLTQRWPARLADHPRLRDRLLEAYAAAHRGYHDTLHLAEVLERIDFLLADAEVGLGAFDRDAVVLAAWFHDAVYDGRPDDVERSADLAEATLTASGVRPALVAEVTRLVRLTLDHRPADDDLAGQVLCDADLAILAADRGRYEEYVRGVRQEYAHLDDETFRSGRAEILTTLLDKPRLFHTSTARESWEEAARANLGRELAELTAPGSP